jgi:hypothetical protein
MIYTPIKYWAGPSSLIENFLASAAFNWLILGIEQDIIKKSSIYITIMILVSEL